MYNLLLISISLVGVVLAQNFKVTAYACDYPVAPRPNIYDLGETGWKKYVSAINELNSGSRPTKWDRIAQLHGQVYEQVHSSATFLGWHRAYLRYVESELRNIDPTVSIPYWDWSYYSQTPESDPVLSDERFGYDGNPNKGECLRGGTFEKFRVLYDGNNNPNPHCLRRNVKQKDGKGATLISFEVLDRNTLNSANFEKFWQGLEFGAHAVIHNFLSSDFASHTSPNDPLFFSHHAFVDKLWYDWQRRHRSLAETYAFDHNVKSIEDTLHPFGIKVKDVLNPDEALCYTYHQNHFSWNTHEDEDSNERSTSPNSSRDSRGKRKNKIRDSDSDTRDDKDKGTEIKGRDKDAERNEEEELNARSSRRARNRANTRKQNSKGDEEGGEEEGSTATLTRNKIRPRPAKPVQRRSYEDNLIHANFTSNPVNPYYEVECDSESDHSDYDLHYVMQNVMAPNTYDRTDLNQLRVPLPLPTHFCEQMGYNLTKVRMLERENALLIDMLNRNQYRASDALVHKDNFPKLLKEC